MRFFYAFLAIATFFFLQFLVTANKGGSSIFIGIIQSFPPNEIKQEIPQCVPADQSPIGPSQGSTDN